MRTLRIRVGLACVPVRLCALLCLLALLAGCFRFSLGAQGQAVPVADTGWLDAQVAALALGPDESAYQLEERDRRSFALRMHSAAAAVRSIDVQYYLWNRDLTGRLLAAELLQAARRGVRVRVLLDDIASKGIDRELAALDTHPLIEIRLFNPWHTRSFVPGNWLEFILRMGRPNFRMHNKLWSVDGRLALVGGRNIGDEYFGANADFNFTDLGVLLIGKAVSDAERSFDHFWNSSLVVPIRTLRKRDRELVEVGADFDRYRASMLGGNFAVAALGIEGPRAEGLASVFANLRRSTAVRYVSDLPDKVDQRESGIRLYPAVNAALQTAGRELVLVSAYFVPRGGGVRALKALRERGVTIHVLTNSLAATDVAAVHGGYARRRKDLLRAGINLYELKPDPQMPRPRLARRDSRREGGAGSRGQSSGASLHTKGVVVDGHLAFVGSFNLDPRSARINTENGVFIDDPVFADQVRQHWVMASDPTRSYAVRLDRRGLSWTHREGDVDITLRHEPKAGFVARLLALLFRWLPLETQL